MFRVRTPAGLGACVRQRQGAAKRSREKTADRSLGADIDPGSMGFWFEDTFVGKEILIIEELNMGILCSAITTLR